MMTDIQKKNNIIETAILVGMLIGLAVYLGGTMQYESVDSLHTVINVSAALG